MWIQGRIRKRGLSTTSGRFLSRSSRVQPMKRSRGASFQAAVEKPSMASGVPSRGVHGVAHLGADQGLVAEVVVAGDVLVPELPFARVAHRGAQFDRADLVQRRRRWDERRLGVRPEHDRPGPVLAPLRRRQFDAAVAVHGQHHHACPFVPSPSACVCLRPNSSHHPRSRHRFDSGRAW